MDPVNNMASEECPQITIEVIERYLDEGWAIYDVSTERDIKNHGIKYIALVNPNHPE